MLEALDDLQARARAFADGGTDAAPLRRRLLAVLSTLRRHDAEENEILYCAQWDDLGDKD